jgi:uncharacterized protein
MTSPFVLAVLGLTIVATSFMSGVFGMAGGLVLVGVLLLLLDVAPAMILFGSTQAAANGWRAALWVRHVKWGIVWRYLIGAAVTFVVLRWLALFPNKAIIYIGLGLSPFLADLLPKSLTPDITRQGAPYVCGVLIMITTLLAGVAGPILDVFYQKSGLDRREVVATKATTQTAGHLARIVYFGSFPETLWIFAAAITLAMLGTTLAARVLEGISNEQFRHWSRCVIYAISAVYGLRGIWLLLAG